MNYRYYGFLKGEIYKIMRKTTEDGWIVGIRKRSKHTFYLYVQVKETMEDNLSEAKAKMKEIASNLNLSQQRKTEYVSRGNKIYTQAVFCCFDSEFSRGGYGEPRIADRFLRKKLIEQI